jgi:hypothetical protein
MQASEGLTCLLWGRPPVVNLQRTKNTSSVRTLTPLEGGMDCERQRLLRSSPEKHGGSLTRIATSIEGITT